MFEPSDNQVRHLEIIQGVINRMASNTFALKVLAGILAAAVLSYAGAANDVQPVLVWIGVIPVGAFWYLDCRYLRLEKLFRKLYNAVRKGNVEEPFDMNCSRFDAEVPNHLDIAWSWSVRDFYLTLVGILLLVSFVLKLAD